ncbi:MAG: type II toxin-antitoxin system VapB family antitoxin [Betaproteobacteria bacterium]|nr:MAG: type II toxin-antitoxin system VapB family antitoxin [Betaproteobacteria bacterium]
MRTDIEIDDRLLAEAMRAGGFKTKPAAVEEGLRLLIRKKAYSDVLALRGMVHWKGEPLVLRGSKRR